MSRRAQLGSVTANQNAAGKTYNETVLFPIGDNHSKDWIMTIYIPD